MWIQQPSDRLTFIMIIVQEASIRWKQNGGHLQNFAKFKGLLCPNNFLKKNMMFFGQKINSETNFVGFKKILPFKPTLKIS